MAVYAIKQGDTAPPVRVRFQARGVPIDLTGATVRFIMARNGAFIDAPAVVTNATIGQAEYRWTAGDTAALGVYDCELKATLANGSVVSSPPVGFHRVAIVRDLA